MRTTESLENTATNSEKIAWLSAQNPAQEFTSLMHHINVGTLQSCFDKLDGKKALGADRVSTSFPEKIVPRFFPAVQYSGIAIFHAVASSPR